MNSLAELHLRQARAFLADGQPQRAVELLEKARALSRDDQKIQGEILQSLAAAYQNMGLSEKESRCLDQLGKIRANSFIPPPGGPGEGQGGSGFRWRSLRKIGPLAAAIILLTACAILGVWWKRSAPFSSSPKVVTVAPAAAPATAATNAIPATMNSIALPNAKPAHTISSTPAIVDEKVRRCVGLLVLMGQYEGLANGNQLHVDLPLASGTAFVVKRSGILLTTKQLARLAKENNFASTLENFKLPTVTLRDVRFIFCTSADPKDWCQARLLYESDKFNLAVLATGRQFDSSLDCTGRDAVQGETLHFWGYPGVALTDKYADQSSFTDMLQELPQTHSVNLLSAIRAPWFKATEQSAEVAVPERNINGTAYVQLNAGAAPGETGGPIVDKAGEVIAITNGTNGILMNQLQDELAPYITGD